VNILKNAANLTVDISSLYNINQYDDLSPFTPHWIDFQIRKH